MNIKGQLSSLFTIICMSGMVYAATVELAPSTLPNGASNSSPFMQALTITFQNNGAGSWAANEKIYIYTPTEIGIADPNGDGTYTDGVSISLTSGAAVGASVSAADAGSITLNFSTGNAIASGDKFVVIFPVTTTGASDGQTENYSIIYNSGDEEVGGESVTATFETSVLNYVSWNTDYTGDNDTSSDLGRYYPSAPAAVLSAGLTDWVVEQSSAANDEVVNGTDADFEGVTLDNSEGGDEMTFSLWFSTSSSLITVTASNATLVDGDNVGAGTTAPNESGTFAGIQFDYDATNGSELVEGTLYFYVTSDWTGDWALGKSGSVVIKHEPVISNAGLDYDDDGNLENANAADDDKTDMYLDSDVKSANVIALDGTTPSAGNDVDNIDILFSIDDKDSDPTVKIFLSTTGSTCVCSDGTDVSANNDNQTDCEAAACADGVNNGVYTLPDLSGATAKYSAALSAASTYNYDIYTDASTYETSGSYYVFVQASDGTTTNTYQVQDQTDSEAFQVHVSHYPYFKFTDVHGADDLAFDTGQKQYQYISWAADDVNGDYYVNSTSASIKLYASDFNYAAAIATDETSDADLSADVTADPDGTVLITTISGDSDAKSNNEYMWDVRSSGLAAGEYHLYAFISDGTNGVLVQYNSGLDDVGTATDNDRDIDITHGSLFMPVNPAASVNQAITTASQYEFRWDNSDKDAATQEVHIVLSPTNGLVTDWTEFQNIADHFWVNSTDGNDDNASDIDASSASSYIWDVATATVESDGNGGTPSGTYYVYYFFSTDGTFSDNEYPYQADGTLSISSATDNDTYFELSPNAPTVSKDDLITFSVYAQDDAATAEIVSVSISLDNTYFEVQSPSAPFTAVTTDFNGTVATNTVVTSGTTDELRWVSWADGGDDIGAALVEVANFQVRVLQDGESSATELASQSVSFNTSGEFSTGIVKDDNTSVTVTASDATVYLVASGQIAGDIDLQGRSSALTGQTVTVDVCPVGSYTASFGGSVTLGSGGSYSVTNIAPGKYTVRVSKDGFLSQVVDNVKVVPFTTTWLNFTGSDQVLGGDVTGYTDSNGDSQPNNIIETGDATAIVAAFGTTSSDDAWNAYADVDNSGTVYVDDLNYAAKNRDGGSETGEGPIYKRNEADNLNALISLRLINENNSQSVFNVNASGIGSLHAYAVELSIDANEWEVISITDHLKSNGDAVYFSNNKGHQWTSVSALFGRGSVVISDLLSLELKPLVDNPNSPVIQEVTLIDDMNRSSKAVISNNGITMPEQFELKQNFPNPFNPVTNIAFSIPQDGIVNLTVFDLLGQEVSQLVSSRLSGGNYSTSWNATDAYGNKVSSGLYFYSLTVDNQLIDTHKMILMK